MKLKTIIFFTIVTLLTVNFIHSKADYTTLEIEKNKVTIQYYYTKPLSLHKKNTTIIKGVSEGEFIEIRIQGYIKDFEHIKLKIGNSGNLNETETLNNFEELSNQTIIINSSIPEGMPMEKIKWKSFSNKIYEFIITENGKDGTQVEFNLD